MLPLPQTKVRRENEKPWFLRYPQLSAQLLIRVEGVASHKGTARNEPSGSQVAPPPPIIIPSSPIADVVTIVEDYASKDEGRTAAAPSPVCRRQFDFVDKPYVPKAPQLPVNSCSILSLNPAIVQHLSGSIKFISPANVQPQPEFFFFL